jgi:nucleotide-binding universal stress UspA family protein
MYSKIVVGTDGSSTANEAVRHAAALAKATGATLHIVHAFQPAPAMATLGIDAGVAMLAVGSAEEAQKHALDVLQRSKELASAEGATAEGYLEVNDPASALLDTAERLQADLLVVGNKGMSGVKRFVLGSVPNKVSHHCPCSLLIVNTTG